jgi:hypothetical protein
MIVKYGLTILQICGKVFTKSHNLTVHQRGHQGVRPFSCPKCEATFRQKAHLERHLAKVDSCIENELKDKTPTTKPNVEETNEEETDVEETDVEETDVEETDVEEINVEETNEEETNEEETNEEEINEEEINEEETNEEETSSTKGIKKETRSTS